MIVWFDAVFKNNALLYKIKNALAATRAFSFRLDYPNNNNN
jgi:hypothetical protein